MPWVSTGASSEVNTRKEARGGDSLRRRPVLVATDIGKLRDWETAGSGPSSGARTELSGPPNVSPETARNVYGLAVAAACLLYILYRPYGVAAPAFDSALMSPPFWRMAATSSAQNQLDPSVVLGHKMERAMPALEKGLPTWARAKCSIRSAAALEQPKLKYVYEGFFPVRWVNSTPMESVGMGNRVKTGVCESKV